MEIKILSWNIWVNNYFDQVQQLLKQENADVIGLQEVVANDPHRNTVAYLKKLGYQGVFAPLPRPWANNNRSDGPAIFTKFPITNSRSYVLSKKYGVGAVHADIKIGEKIFHFFSTHLSHTHQQESSEQQAQVTSLIAAMPKESSVLMGDFNAIPQSTTIKQIVRDYINIDQQNIPTWSVYPAGCEVCKLDKVKIRLDYIFTSPDIINHSYKVLDSTGSDHLPISTMLKL